ncbi:MAG: hypothetical protein QW407_05655 [Thermofilaceae archaeon]
MSGPRTSEGGRRAVRQGAFGPTSSGGIRAEPGETREGTLRPPHASRKNKAPGEGYRVFKIELNAELRETLKKLYESLVAALLGAVLNLPKGLLYYGEEWKRMRLAAFENRIKAGKRTPPKKLPPVPLPVRFRWGGREYGSRSAVCVIDLDACVLRVWNIIVPLDPRLCEVLRGELELAPPPKFTLFLTQDGELRLVAHRCPPKWWVAVREESSDFRDVHLPRPFVAVGVDVNSRHGTALLAFRIDEDGVKLILRRRLKPPRRKLKLIKLLQSFAALAENAKRGHPSPRLHEVYSELRRELPERLASLPLTPANCKGLIRCAHRANTKRVESWERRLSFLLRSLCRRYERAVVAIDTPRACSLKGTRYQNTLLRVRKRLKVLCYYEGAFYKEVHVSGRQCPLCGGWGLPIPRERGKKARRFECQECNLVWDRDFCACFKAVLAALPWLHEAMVEWLRNHPTVLCPAAEQ